MIVGHINSDDEQKYLELRLEFEYWKENLFKRFRVWADGKFYVNATDYATLMQNFSDRDHEIIALGKTMGLDCFGQPS